MKLTIIHGGQTGVDRGAAHAAGITDPRLAIEGFMPMDESDEDGLIPVWVASKLKPLKVGGRIQRTVANVVACDAVLVIVEDRTHPYRTPGSALTLQTARSIGRPRLAVDNDTPIRFMEEWLRGAPPKETFRLMVAGPRRSLWPEGEFIAESIVVRLANGVWSR